MFALDIESALTELERARTGHAEWVAAIHQAVITRKIPETLDLSPESHRRSPLGRWCEERWHPSLRGLVDHAHLLAIHREAHEQARRLVLGLKQEGAVTLHHYEALAGFLRQLDRLLSQLISRAAHLLARTGRIAAAAFDQCTDAVLVTDPQGVIIYVNPGFTEVTGFEADEALGKTPRLFKSGRHDNAFYEAMWLEVARNGLWRGEIWNRHKNGESYLAWLSASRVCDAQGAISHYVATISDITVRKKHQEHVDRLAYYDSLTGLPNRVLYRERLTQALALARRQDQMVGVLFIDLDRFKQINDTLGHGAGDAALIEVARRLQNALRESDAVARISGDEFVVVLTGLQQKEAAVTAARKISALLERSFALLGHELNLVASIGIALFPDHGDDVDTLTKSADVAMYDAKRQGGNRCRLYSPALRVAYTSLFAMGMSLRRALERQEFRLFYQPLIRVDSGQAVGMEALLRWQHPEEGLLMPARFVPVAEQNGSIVEIGDWVLRSACRDAREWQRAGQGKIPVSVNISPRQLVQRDFAERVVAALDESELDPELLYLELSESALLEDPDHSIGLLRQLKSIGVRLAIDHFGNGHSGFSSFRRFPIDTLKIDQNLFRNVSENGGERALAKAVFDLARALELEVVAEGVETLEQLLFVKRYINCNAQGFYFSEPLPSEGLTELIRSGKWS